MRERNRLVVWMLLGTLLAGLTPQAAAQQLKAPKNSGMVTVRYGYDDQSESTQGFDVRRVRLAADVHQFEAQFIVQF